MLQKVIRAVEYSDVMNSTPTEEIAQNVKVTLVRPPIVFSAQSYSTPVAMPIGLAYLAAVLLESKFNVEIIDAVGLGMSTIHLSEDKRFKFRGIAEEEILKRLEDDTGFSGKRIIGITIMFSQEWPHIRELIKKIRKNHPDAIIVTGGEHVTAMPEYSLNDCPAIDYIIRGEGELAFLEFVSAVAQGIDPKTLQGLSFLRDGVYSDNKLAPRIKTLDNFPWPAWQLMDVEPYFRPNDSFGLSRTKTMGILATRGCPYQCTFCSNEQMYTTQYKMRPVQDVINEIKFYKAKYDINSVEFYDLTAIVNSKWILDFAHEIKVNNLNIEWQLPSGTRSEALSDEVLMRTKESGLSFITYAPESGSERMLKSIKKRVSLDKMFLSIKSAKKHNLIVKVNFIIGFPEETRMDVYKTAFCISKLAFMNVDDCNVALFSPYPGSELYNSLRERNIIKKIDDSYFEGLMTQFDLFIAKTVCDNIPAIELMLYRTIAMSAFYGISYLRSPKKILRLFKIFFGIEKNFQAQSVFEQRIFDLRLKKANLAATIAGE